MLHCCKAPDYTITNDILNCSQNEMNFSFVKLKLSFLKPPLPIHKSVPINHYNFAILCHFVFHVIDCDMSDTKLCLITQNFLLSVCPTQNKLLI